MEAASPNTSVFWVSSHNGEQVAVSKPEQFIFSVSFLAFLV
uniref:Uncharacterized protein n=1 Tax=Anguilla anguilla TaxID=7936 RepID=A0A0E9R372_ANGAN